MSTATVPFRPGLRRAAIVVLNVLVFWIGLPLLVLVLGWCTDQGLSWGRLPLALRWAGLPVMAAGAGLCAHSALVLVRRGKGLPISALPPTQLVRSGAYRYWRHPIYVGFVFLMAGLGLVAGSPGAALIVVPLVTALWFATWVRLYEEPGLVRRFGWAYRAHCRHTGWLVPGGTRWVLRAVLSWLFRRLVRIRVEGVDQLPPSAGPVIFTCDHGCYLDLLIAASSVPGRMTIPVTAEVFRSRLGRLLVGLIGGIPKRRYGPDPEAAQALAADLAIGCQVGIAVEGERSWTGEMGPLAPGVARFISRCDGLIVPLAIVGSHRCWPRWAPRLARSVFRGVTVRFGRSYRLADHLDDRDPAAVATLVREQIMALRDPQEDAVDPGAYPESRPELALWRCPLCGAEETLRMADRYRLSCEACRSTWHGADGFLIVAEPNPRAGERRTLAGWAACAARLAPAPVQAGGIVARARAELRSASADTSPTVPLARRGRGMAVLYADRLEWRAGQDARTVALADIRSVTTERADTVQLGTGREVVQLVLSTASPRRWQHHIEGLRALQEGRTEAGLSDRPHGERGEQ